MLLESTRFLLNKLNVNTPLVSSSELSVMSKKSNLILDICRTIGATTYLSGPFGRHYLDKDAFERAGIEVQFHEYVHPIYAQAYEGFEPFMSILDLL